MVAIMKFDALFDDANPVRQRRILIVLAVTAVTVGVNLAGILLGITTVLAHLLYFPVILAAYWYPRRCYPFLLFIAVIYGGFILYFNYPPDVSLIAATASRIVIFTLVGLIVSLLSYRLRESEQEMNDIIEFLPDATFAVNKDGVVIAWNKATEVLTGVKKSAILNRGNYEYSLPFYGERRPMLVDLILTGDSDIEARYPDLIREDNKLISDVLIKHFRGEGGAYLRFTAAALKDPYGNVTGAVESVRDVTDKLMTESALSNTTKKLNTLTGIIRTDLSNKLTVLYGYLRMGTIKFRDPEVLSFVNDIKNAAGGIERQINISRDFRDLGTKPPSWVMVQAAVSEAAGKLDFRDVYYRAWTERLEIFADPYLPSVFSHLFDNSLNLAGDVTKIVVTYQVRESGCAVIVEDNGPGIAVPDKKDLFKQSSEEGYGRGLFLTHEILSITGIDIIETGIPGKGARFEILVPPEGYRIR